MKNIKIFCSWDLKFDLFYEKQIELYVDFIPKNQTPKDTIRFVLLLEPPEILDLTQEAIIGFNNKNYDYLFTHNDFLLTKIEKAILFPFGTTWINNYSFVEKEFSVSTLVGGKLMASGHFLRQKLWFKQNKIKNIKTNFYLSGNFGNIENYNNNPILGNDKSPMFNSQFHICIENVKRKNWFTEKLIDCLQTKTVPIYYGCPNIGDWFDLRGFIIVNDLSEIISVCNNLNDKTYNSMIDYIDYNFQKSNNFTKIDFRLKEKILNLIP